MIKREKINFDLSKLEDIEKLFSKYTDIYSAFLFGSYATGHQTPLSDIDICYMSRKKLEYNIESDIAESVRSYLQTDEVDFIAFSKLPLRTQYDILNNGKFLYLSDEEMLCNTRESVIRDYLDFKYYFDEYDRSFKESISKGTFFNDA